MERMRSTWKFFAGAVLCATLLLATAYGQNLGSIVGLVTDATGSVVPNATVKITQQETNVARTVSTDSTGTYLVPTLNVGTYTIEVTASGFKTFRRTDVVLNVRDQIRVDVRL